MMSRRAPQAISLLIPIAIMVSVVIALLCTAAQSLLWRSALVLVPLTAVVAIACRWLPCRPITRHSMWLALLAWPVAGALLPPLEFKATAPEVAARPLVDPRPPVTVSNAIPRSSTTVGMTPAKIEVQLNETALTRPRTESKTRGGSRLMDAECLTLVPKSTDDLESPGGESPADTAPTPPMTVARAQVRTSSILSTVFSWAGQLSPLLARAGELLESGCIELDNRLALLAQQSEFRLSPPNPDVSQVEPMRRPFEAIASAEPRDAGPRPMTRREWDLRRARQRSLTPIVARPIADFATLAAEPELAMNDRAVGPWNEWVMPYVRPWTQAAANVREAVVSLPVIPSSVWALGVVLIVLWRLERGRRFRRLIQRARRAPVAIRSQVSEAAREIGLRDAPRVLMIADRVTPLIWFDGVPTLVLPSRLWEELDEAGRRAVLFHELAHLRRRDHWVCRYESWVGAIYWWHPVVWWIRSRLQDEAENCCDAWVTWLQPGGRRAYAEALIRTKHFISDPRVAAPASAIGMTTGRARRFARRLTMVMTQRVAPSFSGSTFAFAVGVLAAGWLATPAQSCEPAKNKSELNGKTLVYTTAAPSAPVTPAAVGVSPVVPTAPSTPRHVVVLSGSSPALAPLAALATPMPSDVVMEALPLVAIAHDDPADAAPERGDRLEARVRRLEERLERLTALLERQQEGGAKSKGAGRSRAGWVPATPPPPPQAPRAIRGGRGGVQAGASTPFSGRVAAPGMVYGEVYPVPDGRREALLALMVRPDVPPRVREVDGGIEFNGSAQQHAAFSAYVEMITGDAEQTGTYHLPEGKLKAITELMERSDVPVFIEPNDENLRVRGNGAVQRVMRDFVSLIHPEGSAMAPAADGTLAIVSGVSAAGKMDELRKLEGHAGELAKHAAAHEKAKASTELYRRASDDRRAEITALQGTARELQAQASELEAKADSISDQADELIDQASEMAESLENATSDTKKTIKIEMKALEQKARELEKAAKELYVRAAEVERESDKCEERADAIEESLETDETSHDHHAGHGSR